MNSKVKKAIFSTLVLICMAVGLPLTVGATNNDDNGGQVAPSFDTINRNICANGYPLLIVEGDSASTTVYWDKNDNGTYEADVDEDVATNVDLSQYSIYGGAQNATVASTKITMTGGTVSYIYGGGEGTGATVSGTTSVTISGSPTIGGENKGIIFNGDSITNGVDKFEIGADGLGEDAAVYVVLPSDAAVGNVIAGITGPIGNVFLTGSNSNFGLVVSGGDITLTAAPTIDGTNLYANGSALLIAEGTTGTTVYFDKNRNGKVDENETAVADAVNNKDLSIWSIYGGGKDNDDITGDTQITMTGGTVQSLWGGGAKSTVAGDTYVTITDGEVRHSVNGGSSGDSAKVNGTTHVTISGGDIITEEDSHLNNGVWGGGYGSVGNSNVTISGTAKINSNVQSLGYGGEVTGKATVTISGSATITGSVRGDDYGADDTITVSGAPTLGSIGDTVAHGIQLGSLGAYNPSDFAFKIGSGGLTGGNVYVVLPSTSSWVAGSAIASLPTGNNALSQQEIDKTLSHMTLVGTNNNFNLITEIDLDTSITFIKLTLGVAIDEDSSAVYAAGNSLVLEENNAVFWDKDGDGIGDLYLDAKLSNAVSDDFTGYAINGGIHDAPTLGKVTVTGGNWSTVQAFNAVLSGGSVATVKATNLTISGDITLGSAEAGYDISTNVVPKIGDNLAGANIFLSLTGLSLGDIVATEAVSSDISGFTLLDNPSNYVLSLSGTDLVIANPPTGGGITSQPDELITSEPVTSPDSGVTKEEVVVKPADTGENTQAEIKKDDMQTIVDRVVETATEQETAPQVEIQVETSDRTQSVELTLPAEALDTLAKAEDAKLTVKSDIGTVTFDETALKTIVGETQEGAPVADDIVITIAKTDVSDLSEKQQAKVGDRPVYDLTVTRDGEEVRDFNGGEATVTLPYTPTGDEVGKKVVVFYVDANGNLHRRKATYNEETGEITFTTKRFSQYMIAFEDASPIERFTDLNEGDWYTEAVEFAYDNSLMNGISDTEFAPNGTTTRAMLWTVLARMSGDELTETDVWYEAGQNWAIENEISDGTDPDGLITREQFVTMLYRFDAPEAVTVQTMLGQFSDESEISEYAVSAMDWAVSEGIISGKTETMLDPQGNATRAEISTMLLRYLTV